MIVEVADGEAANHDAWRFGVLAGSLRLTFFRH